MHPKFLNILCCPLTKDTLELEIEASNAEGMITRGKLITPNGTIYPIINGVPRFVSEEYYASSFGFEWHRWPRVQFESENVNSPMQGHTLNMWRRITEAPLDMSGKMIVEFGSGPGRFLDIVRRNGGQAVGIDLSLAVDVARQNFASDPDVLVVQGDITEPPFRDEVFDGGYSIGVLHHTPNPITGLKALAKTIKSHGWVACSVYSKGGLYDNLSVKRFRRLNSYLKPYFGYKPALLYSYLAAYILSPLIRGARLPVWGKLIVYIRQNWLVSIYIPDVRWRILDIFDAITPEIASTHITSEIREWMNIVGCENVHRTDWGKTSFRGTKKII